MASPHASFVPRLLLLHVCLYVRPDDTRCSCAENVREPPSSFSGARLWAFSYIIYACVCCVVCVRAHLPWPWYDSYKSHISFASLLCDRIACMYGQAILYRRIRASVMARSWACERARPGRENREGRTKELTRAGRTCTLCSALSALHVPLLASGAQSLDAKIHSTE